MNKSTLNALYGKNPKSLSKVEYQKLKIQRLKDESTATRFASSKEYEKVKNKPLNTIYKIYQNFCLVRNIPIKHINTLSTVLGKEGF